MGKAIQKLSKLLEDGGFKVSFSIWCRSGLVGDMCQCHRCLRSRGMISDHSTEAAAERQAAMIDRAYKNGVAMGQQIERSGAAEHIRTYFRGSEGKQREACK